MIKRIIFIILIVIAVPLLCSGQRVTKTAAGNFVQVKKAKTKFTDSLTTYTLTDSKGKIHPVYKGAKGSYYVGKISKKGNYYRQYLKTE